MVRLLIGGAEFGRLYIGFRLSQGSLQSKDLFADEFVLKSRPVLQTLKEVCEGDLIRQPMNLDSDQIEPPDVGTQAFSISLLYIAQVKTCLFGRDVHREV